MYRMMIRSSLVAALGLSTAVFAAAADARTEAAATPAKDDQSALNGTYRVSWTEKALIAAGAPRDYAHNNASALTIRLRDGRLQLLVKEDPSFHCSMAHGYTLYTLAGKPRISIGVGGPTCPEAKGTTVANWSLGKSSLRLRVISATDAGDKVFFGGKPWTKIG